jgi:hypothetical protein
MNTNSRSFAVLLTGALALGAARLDAQSPSSIMQPKQAAQRAANATNAHTKRMESPEDAPARPATPQSAATTASKAPAVAVPASRAARAASATSARPAGAAARTARDTSEMVSTSVARRGGRSEIALNREFFAYEVSGRRDPFLSLIMSGELRPMINDLKLVTVIYDATGRSVAILRDVTTKQQYRVKVGQTLGRMRVASIQPKSVTFTLEEFGFSRQEVLALGDPSQVRTQ